MKKSHGFTLIELMIVIVIIGMLAGIILVSTNGARTKSAVSAVKSSIRSIVPAGVICRGATPSPGTVQTGVPGDLLCSLNAGAGGTSSPWPEISQCGTGASAPTFTVVGGGTDNWTVTLTNCQSLAICAGLVVNPTGFTNIPPACN